MIKFCKDCKYCERRMVELPKSGFAGVYVCTNPEYGHVVSGHPMPAEQVRAMSEFCGLEAVGFEPKPAEPEEEEESTIIVEK